MPNLQPGQKIATIDQLGRPIKYYWIETVDDEGRVTLTDKKPERETE